MSTPVVIQGTAVSNPAYGGSKNNSSNMGGGGGGGGGSIAQASPIQDKKETGCNDVIFLLLFIVNIVAIVIVAAAYGPAAFQSGSNISKDSNFSNINYNSYITGVVVIAIISLVFAAGGMAVLMCIPETMVKVALFFVVAMSFVSMLLNFLAGLWGAAVIGLIFFAITLCYAWAVWSRIPFAAINLLTACTAIKKNIGVTFYAYFLTLISALWVVTWSVAFVGVFNRTYQCNAQNVCTSPNYGYLFLLFVAFFYGQQVFQYAIHTTVAGTVATWWFEPESCGCCASSVHYSFLRTCTTSLGSICFGALIVAILQALRMLANTAQQENDGCLAFLACIAECILACIAGIVEYINKWAFVYVGVYGFPYIKSAQSVFQLFRNRGWEAIIADSLVGDTLLLVSIVVGAIIGAIALIIQVTTGVFTNGVNTGGSINAYAFTLGFVVGLTLTSILMSVIGSGVNTVIVLFAEAPADFQQNYPELSNRMRTIWNQVYPGSV